MVAIIRILQFILLCSFTLNALTPHKSSSQYDVQVWNMTAGLPANSIHALCQSRRGYLWLGTSDGLVRFDGVNLNVYNPANTPQLESGIIRALFEDSDGLLWIGTASGGLVAYKDELFSAYSPARCKGLYRISSIASDAAGNLWIGSYKEGLTCFNIRSGQFTTYTVKNGLPHNQVNQIYKDSNDDLWVTTVRGVIKIRPQGGFELHGAKELADCYLTASAFNPKSGELWIGTGEKGVFLLKDGRLTAYGSHLPHPTVTTLYLDSRHLLWIGTDGGGLTRMRNDQFSTLDKHGGLADSFVSSIMEGREGCLWVGTLDGGLHRLKDSAFTVFSVKEGLSDDYTNFVYQRRNGDILIGANVGLNCLKNSATGSSTQLLPETLGNIPVLNAFEDKESALWLGTMNGLYRLKKGVLSFWSQKQGLAHDRINCIFADRRGTLWLGTEKGLYRFDDKKDRPVPTAFNGFQGAVVHFIQEDSRGTLWCSTDKGLFTFNYESVSDGSITDGSVTYGFVTNRTALSGSEAPIFNCLYQDMQGTIWLGTNSGLIRNKGDKTTRYTAASGLQDNYIYSILEDDAGFFWLGGRNGIMRITKTMLQRFADGEIRQLHPQSYNERDGMKSRWTRGNGFKSTDGRLWFPTSAGVVTITPKDLEKKRPPLPVHIEKVVVNGLTLPHNALHKTQTGSENLLKLPASTKRLEFYFTALCLTDPLRIRFKTKLIGYDDDWVDMGNQRSATYTGLTPGSYRFEVKAVGTNQEWPDGGKLFSFYLQPYFYQTPWFLITLGLLALLFFYGLHRLKIRRLEVRRNELKELVKLRTTDLENRNLQLEKAHQTIRLSKEEIEVKNKQLKDDAEKLTELDKAKSSFFANISHEFRTPLTLIKGPLEQILAEKPDKKLAVKADMMLRNSRRLLNLVDQLLELARFDSGKMKLEASFLNFTPFLRSIVMCFDSLAQQNNVTLTFKEEDADIFLYFDPEKMERIIFNLLSNAFNYTPVNGEITVSVRRLSGSSYPDGCSEVVVRDTGKGIPQDRLPFIFDRFYRGDHSHDYKHKGTGIGLALTKELVELHRGDIEVQSNYLPDNGGGTVFIIRLPIGRTHLDSGEIRIVPEDGDIPEPALDIPVCDAPPPVKAHLEEVPRDDEQTTSDDVISDTSKPILLVVDDNPDVRAYIKSALEDHFDVEEALDGKEGVKKALALIPDLVISDVMMPEVDGYELCAQLKKNLHTCHIPIILLTAKASTQSMAQGLETGADDYITKPFNAELLIIRVWNLIRLRRRLQQKIQQDLLFRPEEISVSSMDSEFMKDVGKIIEKEISNPQFNVERLGNKLYMSPTSLRRKMEALTGETPNRFIRSYRLTRAAQLLKGNFGNITEIAFAVGFTSTAYFTKCFKEKFHQVPRHMH